MLLAIDSGNTNAVFGVFDGGTLRHQWRAVTDRERTAGDYSAWLTKAMGQGGLKPADISGAIIANVVPATQPALAELCRRTFGTEPLVVGEAGVDLGMRILVDRPEEVGADRLVNALGARERYEIPAIVIDFGTATTFDVVDGGGDFLGGAIAPGVNLCLDALHSAAAKLPRIEIEKPARVIGKGTVPAMRSGIYWGYVGLIEGLVARISAEMGGNLTVVATGGLAPLFAEATPVIGRHDPDLTLYGLLHAYRRSAAGAPAPR